MSRSFPCGAGGGKKERPPPDGSTTGCRPVLENYVVRIYRRAFSDPERIIGVVREVGSDGNVRFGSFEELRRILCGCGARPRKGKKRGFRDDTRRPDLF